VVVWCDCRCREGVVMVVVAMSSLSVVVACCGECLSVVKMKIKNGSIPCTHGISAYSML
jgi:hypothetical protein